MVCLPAQEGWLGSAGLAECWIERTEWVEGQEPPEMRFQLAGQGLMPQGPEGPAPPAALLPAAQAVLQGAAVQPGPGCLLLMVQAELPMQPLLGAAALLLVGFPRRGRALLAGPLPLDQVQTAGARQRLVAVAVAPGQARKVVPGRAAAEG